MQNRSASNFAGLLVRRFGENSCLVDAPNNQVVRGQRLSDLVVRSAVRFLAAGLRPGDRVVISCGVNLRSALAYLGAMYAGIVPVMVDERVLESKGSVLCERTGAKAMWADVESRADWVPLVPEIDWEVGTSPGEQLGPAASQESGVAVLIPTSGSTGVPRLVAVTHGNLRANTEAIVRSQRLADDERAMLIMPVSYCFGASVLHTHLYQGGGVVFDSRFMFPDRVLEAVDTYGCTTFAGVPTAYNILLRRSHLKAFRLPTLRRFLQAGGALSPASIREFADSFPTAEFYVMYGQTEATARISCFAASSTREKIGSVGLPLDNLQVRIVGADGTEISNGQTGEIHARGPSICSGYFGDAESSSRKFKDGWLRTGDLGRMDEDGYLWIKGRVDEFVKIRGVRVGLREVEERVAAIPGVYECAAVGVEHPEAGEALAIYIVAEKEHSALDEAVRRTLPPHWTCVSVNVVADLPRTTNGKTERARLRALT